MKTYKTSKEFVIGKHNISYFYNFDQFKDETFEKRPMPTFQKLPRSMTDAQIESELKPGICTLGDVIAFLDNAPEECKDGWANLFYLGFCVVRVRWGAVRSGWSVDAWGRGGRGWRAGDRVLSPANSKVPNIEPERNSLETLVLRVERIEKILDDLKSSI